MNFRAQGGGIRKEFGSMNMDEFLKNIWTAEESQAMAAALGAASATDETAGLQRQGTLTLSRTLSQKTVDEVWRDLKRENAGDCGGSDLPQQQRQQTLGEMTLEEFLMRAGVLREEINSSIGAAAGDFSNNSGSVFYGDLSAAGNTSAVGVGYSHADRGDVGIIPAGAVLTSFAGHLPVPGNVDLGSQPAVRGSTGLAGIDDPAISNEMMPGMVGFGAGGVAIATADSPANQINSDGLTKGNGELSPLSPVPYMFSGGLRGKKCNGTVEKVVERRQRRMIKNRESAARSRARKQAYTMELEAEVAKLKEQNQELQRHQVCVNQLAVCVEILV
ncbi:Abscisic acid-insensitive 5-like protein 5 [Apostasia shenzhenica]|uniref:Abscisic acid-insensitive 5-like protein 5 n=1 Tax=Apostasia shenzhenica TaxID=1088818 RepID=A0A2I0ASE6_9ASPA|nr:Abscisic acid-insensitive 5-like protein 5 [Apostasia shenzhenica]